MPLLPIPNFKSSSFLPNGHWQSIYPSVFRKVKNFEFQPERLELPDGDFLDLDWVKNGAKKLVILTHGLEGSSRRTYMKGMARIFSQKGWDALAWNCRSCSGEMNRTPKLYHHGDTHDIAAVIKHALQTSDYEIVVLIGFSMGGAITMNYLGRRDDIPSQVKTGIGYSMPTELEDSVYLLNEKENKIYRDRFLKQLSDKIIYKSKQFPGVFDVSHLKNVKEWRDFDVHYSAPMNNYRSPEEFYRKSSALYVLENIKVPFLIANAKNDPLLTERCSPVDLAEKLPLFHLEILDCGGHVGFYPYKKGISWLEERAVQWVDELGL